MADRNSYYRVFYSENHQGNIAIVSEVDTLPSKLEKKHPQSDNTLVYIAPLRDNLYEIIWFQHGYAIQRCGHGTLAAAKYLHERYSQHSLTFLSQSDTLKTKICNNKTDNCQKEIAALNLPDITLIKNKINYPFATHAQYRTNNNPGYQLLILPNKNAVDAFLLNTAIKNKIGKDALIISAQDSEDAKHIYFRYFAPAYGREEDSATGSAANILWAYWQPLTASSYLCYEQQSIEGGIMYASQAEDGIWLEGHVIAIDQQ